MRRGRTATGRAQPRARRRARRGRTGRRAGAERGAALVEAAIVVPLVVLLTFGAIEFGFAFNEQGTTRSATRSAARAASTQSKQPSATIEGAAKDALTASVRSLVHGTPQFALVYRHAGTDITTQAACATDCMVLEWTGPLATGSFARTAGNDWNPEEQLACAGRADRVAVFLEVRHDFVTGIPGTSGVTLRATTVMALEPFPGASCERGFAP